MSTPEKRKRSPARSHSTPMSSSTCATSSGRQQQHHHTPTAAQTSGPSNTPPQQRWSQAVQHALEQASSKKSPRRDSNNNKEDAIGNRILELIQQTDFRQIVSEKDKNNASFRAPLFSRHNLTVLRQTLGSRDGLASLLRWMGGFLICEDRPSRWKCFEAAVQLLAGCAVLTAGVGSTVIVYSALWLYATITYLLALLVDWEGLQKYYVPSIVPKMMRGLQAVYNFVDANVLQGNRYAGREWDRDGFVWSDRADHAASREASLWDLPPPKEKPDRFWQGTRQHVGAIEYCYTMMHNEHERKKEKRRRKTLTTTATSSDKNNDVRADISPNKGRSGETEEAGFNVVVAASTSESRLSVRSEPSVRVEREASTDDHASPREAIELEVGASPSKRSQKKKALSDVSEMFSDEERNDDEGLHNFSDLTDVAADMPWIDVGAKIGLRLLNSEHIQRAVVSQETKDRILETMGNMDPTTPGPRSPRDPEMKTTLEAPATEPRLSRPMHSMWTSPAAAAEVNAASNSNVDDGTNTYTEESSSSDTLVLRTSQTFPASPARRSSSLPPVSPHSSRGRRDDDHSSLQNLMTPHQSLTRSESENSSEPSTSVLAASPPGIERIRLPNSIVPFPELALEARKQSHSRLSTTRDHPRHQPRVNAVTKGKHRVGTVLYKREPLASGVKVAVPLFPILPGGNCKAHKQTAYQMATVVSSKRVYVGDDDGERVGQPLVHSNCLSVTVKLEKCFLRNGEFAELTFRVLDEWGPRSMPRHSKVPIGSCVATSFGIGVLVGWRVETDCYVVRSLWRCRGSGSAHAYLNRKAIHSTIEAAVGFRVQTMFGWGVVIACTNGGSTFEASRFFVLIKEEGRHSGRVLELHRKEILSCHVAQFMPIIEHIREAAHYQIQLNNYNAALREERLLEDSTATTIEQEFLHSWSACAGILWDSFLKAVEEDKDFDDGVNDFMKSIIGFLDRLDQDGSVARDEGVNQKGTAQKEAKPRIPFCTVADNEIEVQLAESMKDDDKNQEPGFWIMNDLFGGVFQSETSSRKSGDENAVELIQPSYYERAFAVLRTLMKTVSIARAASVNHPHFRLALAIIYDFLLFVRTIVKIQQRNTSAESLKVWRAAWDEIVSTFGPIKERLENIGRGIAQRMENQGRKAKVRVLRFADKILSDERLLFAVEQGEWDRCLGRIEIALVEAQVIEEDNLVYYRKAARFVYEHVQMTMNSDGGAATRNSEKLAVLAHIIQRCAAPRRSILKLFCRDDVLEILERILVRSFYKEELATRMLTIHAANFHSLRHLRMLKDFSVAGRIWIPLLNAADEEISWLVSNMPEKSKSIMCPLSSLFSLCVAQFHRISAGDLSKDWLAFLLDEDSVRIIHDIDMMLILALESFSRDVREMMTVLPYYPSIEEDILNLMDEVNLDEFLREMSDAIDDPEKLSQYIREKATIAVERFLNYLPKMSIPVERRDLGDGWVLTCHGEDGGGLTLSDVSIKRDNLVCQVLGDDTLFFPMFATEEAGSSPRGIPRRNDETLPPPAASPYEEESILDHIRVLIENAEQYGCWESGVGGVGMAPTDRYAASVLRGLPVSQVLNCSIELWRNLEIDDDELLEIAIRDISYHIELHEKQEKTNGKGARNVGSSATDEEEDLFASYSFGSQSGAQLSSSSSSESGRHRFNPRLDPTVLFLEIKNLTLNLDNFFFRIEKGERKTIFDPVFEGRAMLSLQNVTIRLRVECAKERVKKTANPGLGTDISTPILQLRDLEVKLEKLQMMVKDTGFGSDWVLNKAVEVFEEKLTAVVEGNLKEQIIEQAQNAVENINSYFLMNPDLLLNLLGISIDDLDENVVWV